jgi:hypothetical protein
MERDHHPGREDDDMKRNTHVCHKREEDSTTSNMPESNKIYYSKEFKITSYI